MNLKTNFIFFDALGTLFSVRGSVADFYSRYARRFGFEMKSPEAERELGRTFSVAFREQGPMVFPGRPENRICELERQWWRGVVLNTFARLGPFPHIEQFFEAVYEAFRTSEAWVLEPGARETLMALRSRGIGLGIISNFDSRLYDVLRSLEILEFFDLIVISSRAPAAKPDTAIFHYAAQQAGYDPSRILHVGDDVEGDFRAAQKAGFQSLLYDPRGLCKDVPDKCLISRLGEVTRSGIVPRFGQSK
ncbi:MAG: HAD-IA family hydrolase [Acidobacteriota bacterium]